MKLKSLAKDSIVYTLGAFFSKGITFLLLPFLTRVFDPAYYGVIDILTVTVTMLLITCSLQFDQALARFYISSQYLKLKMSFFSTALTQYIVGFGLASVLIVCFRNTLSIFLFNTNEFSSVVLFMGIHLFFEALLYFVLNQLKWEFSTKKFALLSILKSLFGTGFVIAMLSTSFNGPEFVFIGYIMSNIPLLFLGLRWINERYSPAVISKKRWKQMFRFSYPLIFSSISIHAVQYMDRFFVNYMIDTYSAGIYAVSVKISLVVLLIFGGFSTAFGPHVYKHFKDDIVKEKIAFIFKVIIFLSFAVWVSFSLFGPELLFIITTPAYFEAHSLLPFMVGSAVFFSLGVEFSIGFGIAKKNQWQSVISVIGALINALLNYVLIQKMGLIGAALATFISFILIAFASILISQRYYNVNYSWKRFFLLFGISGIVIAFYATFLQGLSIKLFGVKLLVFLLYIILSIGICQVPVRSLLKKIKKV